MKTKLEIRQQLESLGVVVTNTKVVSTAKSLGFDEAHDYTDEQADRIIATLQATTTATTSTTNPTTGTQNPYQQVSSSEPIDSTALALFREQDIARGYSLAARDLESVLSCRMNITHEAYKAGLMHGLGVIEQQLDAFWGTVPTIALEEITEAELLPPAQVFDCLIFRPEVLALGMAR